jgi:pimeloyl-ACP methyl ester carboxylesterase
MAHPMSTPQSRFVEVDGIRTHYLEAGAGPTVVLLHSGEFGAAAELSWEFTLPALAQHFHVIAPDWLGFGRTDKVFDFAAPRQRVFRHLQGFIALTLAAQGVESADFIGNSMGATNLLRIAAEPSPNLPLRSMVVASGGGFVPLTPERQTLLSYDGTPQAMRSLLAAMLHDPAWSADDAYVARRQELALMPGAWECVAAPRLAVPARSGGKDGFGKADGIPYESISVPTLIVAGLNDRMREKGYAQELAGRIKGSEVHVLDQCGHCPNIEQAARFNELAIDFLKRVHAGSFRHIFE